MDEQEALRAVAEGTASATGQEFFTSLVRNLALALGTYGAWVTEYLPGTEQLRTLAFWIDGEFRNDYTFTVPGSPCERVVHDRQLIHVPDRVVELYPDDPDLTSNAAVSYLGVPLLDDDGRVLGHLAVLDVNPMPREERLISLFRIFANRAVAELRRLHVEAQLRERQEKLGRLVDGAMDAIVELDGGLRIALVNGAAEKLFGAPASRMLGETFARFLESESAEHLARLGARLGEPGGDSFLWVPGGFAAVRFDGSRFAAEATISRYEVGGRPFHTLILRNVNDRLEAERRIRSLVSEAEYLRERLGEANPTGMIGDSPAIRRVLHEVSRVAPTAASVLIYGETGTGKELVARAIHDASSRSGGPMIKVNCAAIPGTLIESELFGHERGAFTGATQRRVGRFALADGGTIFLDEIGELPLELQGKLLRVLQEGEFEPVGSSRTRKADVRVIAATNRDLEAAVRRGEFREDLYYRLSVFPIRLPALRDRGDDVVLIASALAATIAQEMGRTYEPLSAADAAWLKAYPWPGNVRELRNVIERALIISTDGRLDLERALPVAPPGTEPTDPAPGHLLTQDDLRELEKKNIMRALAACGWRVGGKGGAASLLGMNPSTLKSRIKALGMQRPAGV